MSQPEVRHVFLQGMPASGKTTCIVCIWQKIRKDQMGKWSLRDENMMGFCTEETRSGNARTGFTVRDLSSNAMGQLASVVKPAGAGDLAKAFLCVGKYWILRPQFEAFIDPLLRNAKNTVQENKDQKFLFFCDEVGSMELKCDKLCELNHKSEQFYPRIRELLDQKNVTVIGTLPARGPLPWQVREILARKDVQVKQVAQDTRNDIPDQVIQAIEEIITAKTQIQAQG